MPYSEKERDFYYFGLLYRSPVRLIARSSRTPFRYEDYNFNRGWPSDIPDPERKRITVIGAHPIVDIYDEKLRSKVLQILEGINWQCVDVVRIGYEDEGEGKPVVLVSGEEIDAAEAQRAVDGIHKLMVENGLDDVHAEFKSGRYVDLAYGGSSENFPTALDVTPLLGAGIGNDEAMKATGSICLYLTIRGVPYALTCRHVVWAGASCPVEEGTLYSALPGEEPIVITQPSHEDFNDLLEVNEYVRREERDIFGGAQGMADALAEKAVLDTFSLPLGTLYYASADGRNSTTGCHQDFALIRLSAARFPVPPPNVFPPITDAFSIRARCRIQGRNLECGRINGAAFEQNLTRSKMLTVTDIRNRLKTSSFRVLKHGRSTGWTAGGVNQLESNCRRASKDQAFITRELCVVNLVAENAGLNVFSCGGDSGACVIDLDGCVVGMVQGGNKQTDNPCVEVSYVTPMEWVLRGIEEDLGLGPDEILF